MEYIVGLSGQTVNFLLSLGFGFLTGVLYDVIRTIRLVFGDGKKSVMVFDILYAVFVGFMTFIFALIITNGSIMAYVIIGELIGFFIYYITFGIFAIRFSEKVSNAIKKFMLKFFKAVFSPLKKIFAAFKRIFGKITQKSRKNAEKAVKKSKTHLKLCNTLLYNQLNNKHSGANLQRGVELDGSQKTCGKLKKQKKPGKKA